MEDRGIKENKEEQSERREKRLVMWVGVTFFMILILFLWSLNIKRVFKRINGDNNHKTESIQESLVEFNKTFDRLKSDMKEANDEFQKLTDKDQQESVKDNENINKKNIEALKEKLEASSTDIRYEKEQ